MQSIRSEGYDVITWARFQIKIKLQQHIFWYNSERVCACFMGLWMRLSQITTQLFADYPFHAIAIVIDVNLEKRSKWWTLKACRLNESLNGRIKAILVGGRLLMNQSDLLQLKGVLINLNKCLCLLRLALNGLLNKSERDISEEWASRFISSSYGPFNIHGHPFAELMMPIENMGRRLFLSNNKCALQKSLVYNDMCCPIFHFQGKVMILLTKILPVNECTSSNLTLTMHAYWLTIQSSWMGSISPLFCSGIFVDLTKWKPIYD